MAKVHEVYVTRIFLLLLGLLCCTIAQADSPLRQSPVGFCSLSSMSSAVKLSTCTTVISQGNTISGIPQSANWALVCAYVQGIVWNDVEAPTSTPGTGGQGIVAGQCFGYSGPLSVIQFIQQTSGAILGVSFYK